MAHLVGQRLGNYRLVQLLGEGGYAQVYLGEHVLLGMQTAIKVLRAHLSEREIERFCQEAITVSRLTHPHIVRLLEFDVAGGMPYLVMEYAPGGTLRQRHPEGIALPLHSIQPYVEQIAAALAHAHAHRLVHRDLKPDNLLIGQHQQILLGDFGLALLAQSSPGFKTQEVVGTVAYMAPEQLQGHPCPASDQYSLGIVLYEWLTGERPFTGSLMEVLTQQAVAPPRPLRERVPTIGAAVEAVVLRALAKDPKERFASVAAFASAFAQASRADTQPAAPSRRTSPLPGAANAQPAAPPRFEWRGKRRYLASAPYALPKDPQEVQRLDFQHFMIRHEMHGNYLAPLDQPRSILDVGCGTGRWAMEMAAEFPQAKVVGIDLVLPDSAASLGHGLARQPENVTFLEGDVLMGLPFADASFDLVYMRFLFTAIPANSWPTLLDEVIRVTRPQGWIESVETWAAVSKTFPNFHIVTEWVSELLRRRGLDPLIAYKMPEMMCARGLERVATYELPRMPPQSRRWKQLYSTLNLAALENLKPSIIAQGIVAAEQYDLVAARARQEIQSGKLFRWPAYITYGQQPEERAQAVSLTLPMTPG